MTRFLGTFIFLIFASSSLLSAESDSHTVRISAARSFVDTGMLQALVKHFNVKNPNVNVEVKSVGSLQALEDVRHAQADLVITHYPHEEKRLVKKGYALKRTQIMFSKYAIFGPPGDDLGLAQKKNIVEVLQTLTDEGPPFIVSSPRGGTYRKIEELWALAGINPDWPDYQYTNLPSSAILRQAAEFQAYAISDMGTYLTNKEALADRIVPIYQDDLALQNLYSVLLVRAAENSKRNEKHVRAFYEFLISDEGQEHIRQTGQALFNALTVVPAASLDPDLTAFRKQQVLEDEKRRLRIVIGLLSILVVVLSFVFILIRKVQKTERKRIEGEIRFRDLVETTPDWVWEVDVNGVYTYVSPRSVQLLGYSPEEIIGKEMSALVAEEETPRSTCIFTEMMVSKEPFYKKECVRRHKDGHLVTIEISAIPIFDKHGNFEGYRGIDRDITDRKTAEAERANLQRELQQSQKMESLGQLTGGVAHDFNNLLGIILGYSELAADTCQEKDETKLVEYLKYVQEAGERGKNLVTQMMAFSRSDKSEDRPLQLATLVKGDVKMLRATLPASVEIQTNISEDLPPVLMTPIQLNQILMNLSINARDAMHGQGVIKLSLGWLRNANAECVVTHKQVSGDWIALSISDTGDGIAPKKIKDIFNPFFTTKAVGSGTGLGLSVVYGILRDHGGHILLETEIGKGTTISLLFPPCDEKLVETAGRDATPEKSNHGNGQRILVVDDEPVVGKFLGDLFEMYDYQPTVVDDVSKALDMFKASPEKFDLLVTDQTMPKMTGVQLIEQIRKCRTELPVILCSGFSDQVDKEKALEMDISYMGKPFNRRGLMRVVSELLR